MPEAIARFMTGTGNTRRASILELGSAREELTLA